MSTDELIVQLARSARPIRPLPPPGVRAMRWSAAALLVMLVAIVVIGPRADLPLALSRPVFLGSLVALLLTLASGTTAAFVLSVPGAGRSSAQRVLPLLMAAGWSAIWLIAAAAGGTPGTAPIHSGCAIQIAVCAAATGWLLFAMVVRAAPLQPLWTAAVASVSSMATGAVVAQVLCPLDDPMHQLIGHVLIGLVVAGAGLVAGHRALQPWRGSTRRPSSGRPWPR